MTMNRRGFSLRSIVEISDTITGRLVTRVKHGDDGNDGDDANAAAEYDGIVVEKCDRNEKNYWLFVLWNIF
jgi:hypothetical protein